MLKKAWLIGMYTIDIDQKVEDLGYNIDHVFATPAIPAENNVGPELIVFSDDSFTNEEEMFEIRTRFPDSLIVSLPVNMFFLDDCLIFSGERSAKRSIARLVAHINERFYRWDN